MTSQLAWQSITSSSTEYRLEKSIVPSKKKKTTVHIYNFPLSFKLSYSSCTVLTTELCWYCIWSSVCLLGFWPHVSINYECEYHEQMHIFLQPQVKRSWEDKGKWNFKRLICRRQSYFLPLPNPPSKSILTLEHFFIPAKAFEEYCTSISFHFQDSYFSN